MVMNGNPNGRKKVEDGFYCWRSNADKVDPNRNWSYNFKKVIKKYDHIRVKKKIYNLILMEVKNL